MSAPAPLESVLKTDELHARPSRPPDYGSENRALIALAQHMADSPRTILKKLAELAMEVCHAGSAGVSLISEDTGDFYWPAIAGALSPHIGGGTPRHFGPCGTVLDRNAMQLFARPEKAFPYLAPLTPPIEEAMLTPFYFEGKAVGTVWVISHDPARKFDAEDLRQIESLGQFAAAAHQVGAMLDAQAHHAGAMRDMNQSLLISAVHQHELTEQAEKAEADAAQEIVERKRAEALTRCQKQSLELLVKGESIEHVLDFLARSMESQSHGEFLVAIHLMEPDGYHFGFVVAPSLPTNYETATMGMDARLNLGPCSSAVLARESTVVHDLAVETRWPAFSAEVVSYGLHGCFTTPITSASPSEKMLGTFALYYRKPRDPSPHDRQLVDFVTHTVALAIDRKQVEHELRAAEKERSALLANEQASRQEAESANRAKDMFLATLSHELRTPLTAILGWAVILRTAPADEQVVKEAAVTIERNAKMQAQLIEDVLDVSRIVSGKLRLEILPSDLSRIIEDAIASVQPAADAKAIHISLDIDPGADRLVCDAGRIQQVVWNLLSNAIKFSPQLGDISVRVERAESMARITIKDNGEGISPDFLPHVFERFRQSDGTSTRKHGGLGLGLSIVRHLIELHGGTVEVHSEGLGKGATFIINLPIRAVIDKQSDDADAPSTNRSITRGEVAGSEPAGVQLGGLRVLVVDDESDARDVITAALQHAGAKVIVADSAVAALKLLVNAHPHVVVSDISMPVQDGYELMKQIRSMGVGYGGRDLPAIALTAYARMEDRRRALLAGFQMHVAKPVDPNELAEVVASLAGRTGLS